MGVAVPLVVGAAAGFAFSRPASRDEAENSRRWRVVLALAVPVVAAFLVIIGLPDEQWKRLIWVPVAGGVLGLMASRTKRLPPWLLMAVIAGLGLIIVWPVVRSEHAVWYAVAGAAPFVILAGTEPVVRRRRGWEIPLALAMAAGGAAAVILASGMITLAATVAALGFALVGLTIPALARRHVGLAGGPLHVAVPLIVLALLVRHLYVVAEGGEIPRLAFVMAAAAPLGLWLGELAPPAQRNRTVGTVLRLAGVLLLSGAAVGLSLGESVELEDDDPYADMYRDMMSIRLSSAE